MALPMAQIPNFQLGATVDADAASKAYSQTANATTGALASAIGARQNQQTINIQAQQQQLAQQKLQQEQGNAIAQNALSAYDSYGDAAGPESFEAFKKGMNLMAPGSVDPNATWGPAMSNAMKTAADAFDAAQQGKRPWPEAIGVISRTISQSGKSQRDKMMPILQSAQDQFNQEQTTNRQQSTQSQDTQRSYADHVLPFIQTGSALNTISQLLSQNTATGDAAAKTLIERNLANGSISKEDADKLTTAGGPLEKMSNYWHTIGTGKTFDDTHRKAMQNWVGTKVNEINNTLNASATAFPGAKPAQIATKKTKTIGGKTYYQSSGDPNWYPQ